MTISFDLPTVSGEWAGSALSEEEYQTALREARRKLERINKLNGTRHGEPYLAILISEAVQAHRLTRYLNAVWDLRERARLEALTQGLLHP